MPTTERHEPRDLDSYSDGMCGWVECTDGIGKAKVHWSVSSALTSQEQAREAAHELLEKLERAR